MKMNEEAALPSFLDIGNMGECLQIFLMSLRKYASIAQSLVISVLSVG